MTRFAALAELRELPVAIATVTDLEDAHPDEPLKLFVAAWLPELGGAFSPEQLRSAIAQGSLRAMKAVGRCTGRVEASRNGEPHAT